jgi:hypothetical protein
MKKKEKSGNFPKLVKEKHAIFLLPASHSLSSSPLPPALDALSGNLSFDDESAASSHSQSAFPVPKKKRKKLGSDSTSYCSDVDASEVEEERYDPGDRYMFKKKFEFISFFLVIIPIPRPRSVCTHSRLCIRPLLPPLLLPPPLPPSLPPPLPLPLPLPRPRVNVENANVSASLHILSSVPIITVFVGNVLVGLRASTALSDGGAYLLNGIRQSRDGINPTKNQATALKQVLHLQRPVPSGRLEEGRG